MAETEIFTYEAVHKRLMDYEGAVKNVKTNKHTPYKCPAGALTIGYGINLDEGLTDEEINYLMASRCNDLGIEIDKAFPIFNKQGGYRQLAIFDMAYNMGIPRLKTFKRMWKALWKEDYNRAGAEVLDSKYAEQVKQRAKDNAYMLRTNEAVK